MADVAIGDRDEFDAMSLGGPHRGHAADLQFAIVRMRAETNDIERGIVGGLRNRRAVQQRKYNNQDRRQHATNRGFHQYIPQVSEKLQLCDAKRDNAYWLAQHNPRDSTVQTDGRRAIRCG